MFSPSWVDVEGNLSLMRSLEVFDVLGLAVFARECNDEHCNSTAVMATKP